MRHTRSRGGWTLLFVFGLSAGLGAVAPAGAEEGALRVVAGRVNAVNPSGPSLTVGDAALTVNAETSLTLNGRPVSLNDLAVGDSARASFDPATRVAREVRAERPLAELRGTIAEYHPATTGADASLVFSLPDGGSVTLFVNTSTLIRIEDGDALEALVGRTARARYDRVTMVAKEVVPGEPKPKPDPGPRGVLGQVVGIDAEHQTLTLLVQRKVGGPRVEVRGLKCGPGVPAVLIVDEQTEITLNDQSATLADLARGDRARCTFVVEGGSSEAGSPAAWRFRALEIRATLPPARTVGGKVVKVDPDGGLVALGNPKRPLALVVTDGTLINLDGKEAKLSQLQPEQRAVALYVVRNDVAQALMIMAMSPPVRRDRKPSKPGKGSGDAPSPGGTTGGTGGTAPPPADGGTPPPSGDGGTPPPSGGGGTPPPSGGGGTPPPSGNGGGAAPPPGDIQEE